MCVCVCEGGICIEGKKAHVHGVVVLPCFVLNRSHRFNHVP